MLRNLFIIAVFAIAAALPVSSLAQTTPTAGTGTVVVTLDNVRHREGTIRAELRTEQSWGRGRRTAGVEVAVPASGPVTVTFTNVPAGRYGVRLFQDRNNDGELQTNFVGFPTEPWGLSNNAPVRMSMPEFSAAAFPVEAGGTARQTIRLR